jgi:hypothetical protein
MTTSARTLTEATRLNLQNLDLTSGLPRLPHIPENLLSIKLTPEQQEANLLLLALWIVERDRDNFDMGDWHKVWGKGLPCFLGKRAYNECGTVHCIAGTAQVMAGEVGFSEFPERVGRLLLGDEAESHFYNCNEDGLNFLKKVIARNS